MKHLQYILENKEKFTPISDPYNHGRCCFKVEHGLERQDMIAILSYPSFLFMNNNVLYFDMKDVVINEML